MFNRWLRPTGAHVENRHEDAVSDQFPLGTEVHHVFIQTHWTDRCCVLREEIWVLLNRDYPWIDNWTTNKRVLFLAVDYKKSLDHQFRWRYDCLKGRKINPTTSGPDHPRGMVSTVYSEFSQGTVTLIVVTIQGVKLILCAEILVNGMYNLVTSLSCC